MQKIAPLQGQVGLVTGGAKRLGAAMARELHRLGMDLVLHYRSSEQNAAQLKSELEAERAGSVELISADLLSLDEINALVSSAISFRGRLDLLVNNASSFYPTPVDTSGSDDWDDLIGSNLKAPYFTSKAAYPALKKTHGCIVNLVDIHAERPLKDYPIYSIAKAGNAMLVKSLAREFAPEVRVNGIAPGAILWPEEQAEDEQDGVLKRIPLRRSGAPEDIADTLGFLVCSADYITGQIIAVDGGRTVQQ